MRRAALAVLVAALLGLVAGLAMDDLLGLARFGPTVARAAAGSLVTALLAGTIAAASARSLGGALPASRSFVAGGLYAGVLAAVAATAATPWVSLGAFGAGPLGELALVVVPAALAMSVALVLATRGASRTPPSSRPPSPRR